MRFWFRFLVIDQLFGEWKSWAQGFRLVNDRFMVILVCGNLSKVSRNFSLTDGNFERNVAKIHGFFRFWGMISWGSPTVAMFEGYRCPQCPRSKQHRSMVAFNHALEFWTAHLPGAVVTQKNLRYRRKMVPWNTDEVMAIDSRKGSLVEVGEMVSEPELQNIQLDSLMKAQKSNNLHLEFQENPQNFSTRKQMLFTLPLVEI